MQHPGLAPRAFSLLAEWLPIPLQCFPHWFPILGRRFHDYFFSLLLEKPCGQASQLFGAAAKLAPLKRVFTFDFDVTDDYRLERWSSTKWMQFQSDARGTTPHLLFALFNSKI